jgi:hypothetical protein
MIERPHPSEVETEPKFTVEQVLEQMEASFDRIKGLKNKEHVEEKRLEDAEGLYLLDIKLTHEDGSKILVSFVKAGERPDVGNPQETAIHITYHLDEEGEIPTGGYALAKYKNGTWTHLSYP